MNHLRGMGGTSGFNATSNVSHGNIKNTSALVSISMMLVVLLALAL